MGNPIEHRCFISYHKADTVEVRQFVDRYSRGYNVFQDRCDAFDKELIDSQDWDYVMRRIREKYLAGTTVTIVLIGQCTWSRRFVDWEIASTLRNDPVNKRSGLLALQLPSVRGLRPPLPGRLSDNLDGSDGYALYYVPPSTPAELATWIEQAYQNRTTRAHLVVNTQERKVRNDECPGNSLSDWLGGFRFAAER